MALNAVMHQAESDDAASLGYFFVTAGAVKFSEAQSFAPGSAQTIVIAQKYGVAVFSDGEGIDSYTAEQIVCSTAVRLLGIRLHCLNEPR
jgi:hypothetical protein